MFFLVLLGLSLIIGISGHAASNTPVPMFPFQFSANILITAHLIEEDSDFPPRYRRMSVYYDYVNKKARADLEAGYEAAKIYIRRYDEKNEYMVRLAPIDDCKRSYLGERMPFPDISGAEYVSKQIIDGIECNYFVHTDHNIRIHMYFNAKTSAPVRLIQESTENNESTPLLTYDYSDVVLGTVDSSYFDLPPPYSHETCVRHVGGFPYLHIFHYFVKF